MLSISFKTLCRQAVLPDGLLIRGDFEPMAAIAVFDEGVAIVEAQDFGGAG